MVFFSQARARAWFQARHLSSMGAASRIRSAAAGWRVGKHASKGTAGVFAVAGGITGLQWAYGTGADFFDNRFVTTSSTAANDIADFYGCEDFMQIFCVFPFVEHLMMRGSFFDDEGTVHTWGLPGTLLVSMEFDDREEEIAGADGETETVVAHFNKRERFQNVLFGHTLWDMVLNFGYNRRADGTCEVYHNGESFRGPFPIRLLFWLHGKYVIWATKKFINGNLFESEDLLDEKEAQRRNIPLHVFHGFLDQLAHDVEQELSRLQAKSMPTAEHQATLDSLRRHQSALELRRMASVASPSTEVPPSVGDGDGAASVSISKTSVPVLQSGLRSQSSTLNDRKIQTILTLVVEDPEVQKAIKAALELRKKEGHGDGDALEQLLGAADNKWLHNAPIGSADRELARRTQSRNQVIYDVGGGEDGAADRRLARSNSAFVIRSRPSAVPPTERP